MLVARRDPPFHVDAKDAAPLNPNVYPPPRASRTARIVTAMQLIGSLLAVPVGIASAYSFYRANFAPETTCQNLRSGIISLLDKSVDASTRRMLVRRDVWDALGGPDPAVRRGRDDLDLCRRAHQAGHRVVVVPRAVVAHAG